MSRRAGRNRTALGRTANSGNIGPAQVGVFPSLAEIGPILADLRRNRLIFGRSRGNPGQRRAGSEHRRPGQHLPILMRSGPRPTPQMSTSYWQLPSMTMLKPPQNRVGVGLSRRSLAEASPDF